jgi:hypothetical protein
MAASMTWRVGVTTWVAFWCVAVITAQTPSSQSPPPTIGRLILPYQGSSTFNTGAILTIKNGGTTNAIGISGQTVGGSGVAGYSEKGGIGVYAESEDNSGEGVRGFGRIGIRGISRGGAGGSGVMGAYRVIANKQTGETKAGGTDPQGKEALDGVTRGWLGTARNGVEGSSDVEGGFGVAGKAENGQNAAGVYGQSQKGFAGFFRGKVTITNRLLVTRIDAEEIYSAKGLTGGLKMFRIDHPLDPANQFLSHGSVESSELKNIYDGVSVLDANGVVEVVLPRWFEALNHDFRYQLTAIGGYAPLYIAREVADGRFTIAGGRPGLKVSWQVTGVRQDAYAKAHPIVVEQPKPPAERGRYLHPVELGLSESLAISHGDSPRVRTLDPAPPDPQLRTAE